MSGTRFAIMTPSYAGDFERCRLLCASIDRHVSGHAMHYLMVEAADVPRFRALEGPLRRIVSDADLLPGWLKPRDNPLPVGPRRLWLSTKGRPMRGWHVQQLRKLALPAHVPEEVLLHCDSDVVFVRPFDIRSLEGPEGVRLYAKRGGITRDMTRLGHVGWCRMAAEVLGLAAPVFPHDDYINNLIVWRADRARELTAHIARVRGRGWIEELVRWSSFSEAMLYGVFVERVLGEKAGHAATPEPLCHTFWSGERMDEADIAAALAGMAPEQVALGLQSFIAVEPEALWRLSGASPAGRLPADT